MIRLNSIRVGSLFSVPGKMLLAVLCLTVFCTSLSAQLFYTNDTEIFIGEETLITQKFSQIQEIDSAYIFLAEETTIIGLHHNQNNNIIYLNTPEKTKTRFAGKHFAKDKIKGEHTSIKIKATPQKETFNQSHNQKKLYLSSCHGMALAPTTTQDLMLGGFPPEEVKCTHYNTTFAKLIFKKNTILLLSACLTTNIRSPPIDQKYR